MAAEEIESILLHHAEAWVKLDPNVATASHVENLIIRAKQHDDSAAAVEELRSYFPTNQEPPHPRIGFGTAGLRGRMQPGPVGMNDLVVIQTAQGLAQDILRHNADGKPLKAVVAYDHRCHATFDLSSKNFAIYTKLVFESVGIACTLLDGYVATPILAFAVTNINAAVGIMVTASHNPKQDDGYKVYWSDGCQIRPPIDERIASSIVEEGNLSPWNDYGAQLQELKTKAKTNEQLEGECYGLSNPSETEKIVEDYFQAIEMSGLISGKVFEETSTSPKIAYTAMHGIGYPFAMKSFQKFNLPPFLPVPSQKDPDPNFSTVPFPNPEEKGALNEATSFAIQNGCDIVLANDPDADRLGVAEFDKESRTWTMFTGDQIGTLLGHYLWNAIGKKSEKPVAMCASTVSSKMLQTMGLMEGFRFEETLTGFKWIGSCALSLQERGYQVLLGYEEAIGFSCGGIIPDKDGISAIGLMATMAHSYYSMGKTLTSKLREIHQKYGEFVSNNGYYQCDDPAIVQRIINSMRNGGKYFEQVGGYSVESVRDLGTPGYDSTQDDKKPTLPTSASSPMLTFRFTNGCVAQFRASGTEPKFKYYIEMKGQPGEEKESVEKRLREMSGVILEHLLEPTKNGLIVPSSL